LTRGASTGALPGVTITFTVTSGPNAGMSGTAVTDNSGNASFSYAGTKTGTDQITASGNDGGAAPATATATVTWTLPASADVRVSLSGPSVRRAGTQATYVATVTNGGPDEATGVQVNVPAPSGSTLVSAAASQGNGCTGTSCLIGSLPNGATATATYVFTLSQAGSLTVTATVQGDRDPNASNNTASAPTTVLAPGQPPPPPPPPSQPGTFNAIPTGSVLINGTSVTADQVLFMHSGDTVDVTNGVLTFTAADGSTGNFSATQPTSRRSAQAVAANLPAQFTMSQPASGGPTTLTLTGGDFSSCGSPRSVSAVSQKPVRALWGSGKGSFTTKGRYAAATVRGTIWYVVDRCDGTLTQVVDGTVAVEDFLQKKTVTVTAGGTYLATPVVPSTPAAPSTPKPVAPLKVPAQSPALVKKRGLLYGGRIYKTKKAYQRRLVNTGHTWAEFARKYPKLAAALAKRR
jgi:uncharacterized repeat protein (TIGR01451 family)